MMSIHEPAANSLPTAANGWPFLRLGFRPFYLGGACFALVALLLWAVALHGYPVAGREPAMSGVIWHAHEMVFGFVVAIVVGFLLTAVRAWTSLDTPRGAALGALWLLWAAARVLVWSGPAPLAEFVDCAFLPIVAVVLLRVLLAAGNRRNIFLTVALALLGVLNTLFHWWALHGRPDLALRAAYAASGLVVMFVCVIAGRVVPMFTANAIPGFAVKRWTLVEALATPLVILTFAADAARAPSASVIALASGAALVHAVRLVGWRSWRVGARPILWILHVAYAWIPLGFAMLALASAGVVAHSLAMHALTVGAIGCAIIGMITRTARGHTGRKLVAGRVEIAAYWLMIGAALARVFGPWFASAAGSVWVDVAAGSWCLAFALYLLRYTRWLMTARVDGKAG